MRLFIAFRLSFSAFNDDFFASICLSNCVSNFDAACSAENALFNSAASAFETSPDKTAYCKRNSLSVPALVKMAFSAF